MAALTVEFPQTVWTVEFGGDEIVVAPVTMAPGAPGGGGAVDSVNGQTGVVVLDAGDVGAVPVSRTITAGAGLVGGGDLSADRTLAQATASLAVAVSAVDGTATMFHVIVPSPGAAAAAPIPAGWADAGAGALPVSFLPAGGVVVRPGDSALGESFGLYRIPAGGASSGPWESLPLSIGQVIGVGTFGSTVIAGTHTGAGVEAIGPDARINSVDARIDGVDARIDGVDARIAVHALGSELAEDITTAFRGDGTADAHWTTPPLTASFTTGICVRALRIPRRPATIPFFAEVFSQTHDSGVGAWDNMEMADLWTDDTYGEDGGSTEDGELRGFWEQTESGGSTDGSGWWPDLCATSDVAVETMVDITFATSTGRMWVRVPHDLDDGGTYHVEADGAVFRLQSTLISAKFASIDNPAGELWRLGERYSGDIVAVTVRDGLGGTLIANPNASLVSPGATSFVDGAGNTWTAGPTASVVDLTAVATHTHSAADITSGTVATARLGSGTADGTTFLRGDQTWATPSGASSPSSDWHTISDTVLASAGSLTVPNLTGLTDVEFTVTGRSNASTGGWTYDGVRMRFNGDGGSNYSIQGGAATSAFNNNGTLPGSDTNTDRQGLWVARFALGGSGKMTVGWWENTYMLSTGTTVVVKSEGSLAYMATSAAITSAAIYLSSGSSFAAGTRFTVRGRTAP